MSVLDELREALEQYEVEQHDLSCDERDHEVDIFHRVHSILDTFADAHPGLVDLTLCGPQCQAYGTVMGEPYCIVDSEAANEMVDAPTGQPCPVLEARK